MRGGNIAAATRRAARSDLRPRRARHAAPRARDAGFTYLVLLFTVTLIGLGLAKAGEVASTAAQRERESELVFVGHAYKSALESYARATDFARDAGRMYPERLEALLEDRRGPVMRRHLRRVYDDPMTGRADWVLIRDAKGGITGVHSASALRPLRTRFPVPFDYLGSNARRYSDWRFVAVAAAAPAEPTPQGTAGGSAEPAEPRDTGPSPIAVARALMERTPENCGVIQQSDNRICAQLAPRGQGIVDTCRASAGARFAVCSTYREGPIPALDTGPRPLVPAAPVTTPSTP